jgi:AcrR family transcriptional regulator
LTASTLAREVDVVNLRANMAVMNSTRDELVEAAAALLEQGGVEAVTLREVGRRAGVSHNAPYKHFNDKEQLLAAVSARDLRRAHELTRHGRRGRSAMHTVRAMLHGYVRHALAHPELFKLTYGPWRTGSAELAAAADAARAALVDAVTAAQVEGDLPPGDPERLAALMLALAHGAADLALAGHLSKGGKGHAEPADLLDDFFDQLNGP